jgi:hypothetical protein
MKAKGVDSVNASRTEKASKPDARPKASLKPRSPNAPKSNSKAKPPNKERPQKAQGQLALVPTGAMSLPSAGGLGALLSFGAKDSTPSPTTAQSSTSPHTSSQEGGPPTPSETWTAGENLLKKMRKERGLTPAELTSAINETLREGSAPITKDQLSRMESGAGPIQPLIAQYLLHSAREQGKNIVKQQLERRGWTLRQLSHHLSPFQPEGARTATVESLMHIANGDFAVQPWVAAKVYELATYDTVKLNPLEKYGPPSFGVTSEMLDATLKQRGVTTAGLRIKLESSSPKRNSSVTVNSLNRMRQGKTRISTEVARVIRELADQPGPNFWVAPTPAQLEAAQHITGKDIRREQERRRLSDKVMIDDLNQAAPGGMKTTFAAYRHMRNGDMNIPPWIAEQFEQMSKSPKVHISALHGPPFYGITPKHLKYQMEWMTEEKLIDWLNTNRPEGERPLNSNLLRIMAEPGNFLPADQVARGRHQIPKWMAELLYLNLIAGLRARTRSSEMIPISPSWRRTAAKVKASRQWTEMDLVNELNRRRTFDHTPLSLNAFRYMKWERRAPRWVHTEVRKMAKERVFPLTGEGLRNIDAFIKASKLPDNTLRKILKNVSWKNHLPGQQLTSDAMNQLFESPKLPFNIWVGLVDKLAPLGVSQEALIELAQRQLHSHPGAA